MSGSEAPRAIGTLESYGADKAEGDLFIFQNKASGAEHKEQKARSIDDLYQWSAVRIGNAGKRSGAEEAKDLDVHR